MPVSVQHSDLEKEIAVADSLIKKVELFDVYSGAHISAGHKGMAYRLTLSHFERTLTAEEADLVQKKVAELLAKKFGAEMRR